MPDGNGLLQCYRDWLAIWDPVIAEQTFMGNPDLERLGRCDVSPDGTKLALAASDSIVHIWDFSEERIIQTMTTEDDPEGYDFVGDLAWFPNGNIGAVSEADNFAVIWDADTGEVVNVLHDIPDNRSAAWSPDGSLLAIVPGFPPEPPYEIQIWDVESGMIVKQWHVNDYPETIAWSPDSRLLASFSTTDGSVILWDMSDLLY
jgi:WD40 repeat protein